MTTLKVRIERIADETAEVKSFTFRDPEGRDLPAATPGSHVDVHPPGGPVRQYSICSAASDRSRYVIAVKREPESRGGSATMHAKVAEGDIIEISAPRNNFALVDAPGKVLLLAGGIGITPVLSMARHLKEQGRAFSLQYFSRSIGLAAFHDELTGPQFSDNLHMHYALEPEAVKTYLRHLLWERPQDGHLYVCGPRPFMDMVLDVAAATWPPDAVHVEYFQADPRSSGGEGDAFEVVLARSGKSCVVAEGQSIAEALAELGVEVEMSCEQGICGTCLTGVLEGVPDHRDMFMLDDEKAANDKMTVCVSRSLSKRLVLDL